MDIFRQFSDYPGKISHHIRTLLHLSVEKLILSSKLVSISPVLAPFVGHFVLSPICNHHQGGLESRLAATIWLPLPKDLRLMHDKSLADMGGLAHPDYIVESVLDLPSVLPLTTSFCGQRCRPVQERRGSNSYVPKTTRNRQASYNRFLPDVPDLYSSSSNSCDSNGTMDSQ